MRLVGIERGVGCGGLWCVWDDVMLPGQNKRKESVRASTLRCACVDLPHWFALSMVAIIDSPVGCRKVWFWESVWRCGRMIRAWEKFEITQGHELGDE